MRWKWRRSVVAVPMPAAKAMVSTLSSVVSSSSCARRIRCVSSHCSGVVPVTERKWRPGAYGHTGRFVVAELRERGCVPLLLGRDQDKLLALAQAQPGLEARQASVDDPASLDRALNGAAAVINCAGPFATTAAPLVEAALRAGIPYVDVAAEIEANRDTFAHFAEPARTAGTVDRAAAAGPPPGPPGGRDRQVRVETQCGVTIAGRRSVR